MITGLDLDTVKAYLGYAADDHTRDVQIQIFIDAALAALRAFTGRRFEYGQYRDTLRNRPDKMYTREWPLVSVEEVKVGDTVIDPTEYLVFKEDGQIYSKLGDWGHYCSRLWLDDPAFFTVLYTANSAALPGDIYLAVLNAIQGADTASKQLTTYGGLIKRVSVYDVGITDLAVPREGSVSAMRDVLEAQLSNYVDQVGAIGTWRLHESEFIGPVTSP